MAKKSEFRQVSRPELAKRVEQQTDRDLRNVSRMTEKEAQRYGGADNGIGRKN